MRSIHTLTPLVVVNRTPIGFIVVCTCGFTAERMWRVNHNARTRPFSTAAACAFWGQIEWEEV